MNILKVIEELRSTPVRKYTMEFVERKGLGHPDYIIDLACEEAAKALARYYLRKYGVILHHNLDKGLLIGGEAVPDFGGGCVIKPIEIIVAGRAVNKINRGNEYEDIPVDEITHKAVRSMIKKKFRFLDPDQHTNIITKIRMGSVDLVGLFKKGLSIPLSNDTSFGVAYAPLTIAEEMALSIEKYMNSNRYKNIFPYVGEDIKVMVLRRKDRFRITIAAAFIDRFFKDYREYLVAKEEVRNSIFDFLSDKGYPIDKIKIDVNTADDPKRNLFYITVTGTSAEAGDDGNTGRGNRVNGLIAPNRQMSLEATAGKNPVSHVGKIYNVLAYKIGKRIYDEVDGIEEVYVKILSQIGKPITEPQAIHIQYIRKRGYDKSHIRNAIKQILDEEFTLDNLKSLASDILNERYELF